MQVICQRSTEGEDEVGDFIGLELRLGEFRLPVSLSEDLFTAMTSHGLLTNQTLQIFNGRHTNLKTVHIHNCVSTE